MDGSDISLAIRRARRGAAKQLDLSQRSLRSWPDDLAGLRSHLERLDVSGNELTSVGRELGSLDKLQNLDMSNNNLQSFPDSVLDSLPNLQSLSLHGNPMAKHMPPNTLRQLESPPAMPGKTPAQVIRGLLAPSSSADAHSGAIFGASQGIQIGRIIGHDSSLGTSSASKSNAGPMPASSCEVEELDPSSDFCAKNAPDFAAAGAARGGNAKPLSFDAALSGEHDTGGAWRKEQKVMLKEIERLQARVQELEEAQQRSPSASAAVNSYKPAWLQESTTASMFTDTLPSRRAGSEVNDEVTQLKNLLSEEQRKTKRLDKEVQRLSERLREGSSMRAGTGSVPHFELNEVEILEQIAAGGFSTVHRGIWHCTKVAVKKIFDPNISAELLAEFDNEIQKLELLRHPNIIIPLAVHRKPPTLQLITEFVDGGSLYTLLHSPAQFRAAAGSIEKIAPKETLEIMESTGAAIAFMHARGIAHRDIKSQNVLLSPALDVKLCDFGLSRMKSELNTGTMQSAGTPNYMAPEIFSNRAYTEKVDVFAYGTMLWEAMAQDIPFANLDPIDIKEKVLAGDMLPMPSGVTPGVQAVLKHCWTFDHSKRPAMADVLIQINQCVRDVGNSGVRARRPRTATGVRNEGLGAGRSSAVGLSSGIGTDFSGGHNRLSSRSGFS